MYKIDIENFINTKLGALSIAPIQVEEGRVANEILEDGYSKDSQRIARYLTTLRKLDSISRAEFRAFKKQALRYTIIDKQLYLARSKNVPSRKVVNSIEGQARILTELHDK